MAKPVRIADEVDSAHAAAEPDRVGYKSPPKSSRFEKNGPSPNPKGRPRKKAAADASEAISASLDEMVQVEVKGKMRWMSLRDVIAKRLSASAAKGDPKALNAVLKHDQRSEERAAEPRLSAEQRRAMAETIVDRLIHKIMTSTKIE